MDHVDTALERAFFAIVGLAALVGAGIGLAVIWGMIRLVTWITA